MHRYFCLVLLLLAASAYGADHDKAVYDRYDLVKVADNVYSFIGPSPANGVELGNSTVVIGEDAVLVVDSGEFPSLAKDMVAEIKKITKKPVRYVVITHWHSDHFWGNSVYRDAYPGVVILSTEFTRQMIEVEGPKQLAKAPGYFTENSAGAKKMLADGKLPDGRPLPDAYKLRLTHMVDTLDHEKLEFKDIVNVPPTMGFEKEVTINLGKREVKVMWLGRANTGGDAITWVPDAKVMAVGDAVTFPMPFAFGSYFSEWPETLQKMVDMDPAVYIPGHGPVMHDATYIKTLIELFRALSTQVKDCVARGLGLDDTRKEVTLEDFKTKLAGDNPALKGAFVSLFLTPAVDRAYQEATGKMKPESADAVE